MPHKKNVHLISGDFKQLNSLDETIVHDRLHYAWHGIAENVTFRIAYI